jgi:riboflavin synthase
MFTGIIESFGKIEKVKIKNQNIEFDIKSNLTKELKIDQSVSHNGVCLTVTSTNSDIYSVQAIHETLKKTNLGALKTGDIINLERGLKIGDRLDGHIVQGHVDETGICTNVKEDGGSWVFSFEYSKDRKNITIEKGSITINGVSLTVVDSGIRSFSVAIIPYTYKNTNFHMISKGSVVNLEFDMIGKYISKLQSSNYNK